MVKFKIIARHLSGHKAPRLYLRYCCRRRGTHGWHEIPGDYDSVGKAVDACRKQQETFPEPAQFSIIVVEFDCQVPSISWKPPESRWMSELTSEKPKIPGRIWGNVNTAQLAFFSGFDIGTPPGYDRPRFED